MFHNDYVRPFMLSHGAVRGRVVRLKEVSGTIIGRHHYPDSVSHLLAQLLALAAMLSSQLKGQGVVTIQLQGNGIVPLMVVDAMVDGELRGYAKVPNDADSLTRLEVATLPPRHIIGDEGYLAITLDPGEASQRYQGVVALAGNTLADALEQYFVNSQQLEICCKLAAYLQDEGWVAGGMLIERMAYEGGDASMDQATHTESWHYAKASAHTLSDAELLDIALPVEDILFRLFHEEGVEVYAETALHVGCRCSRERMLALLKSMDDDDKTEMIVDGKIVVDCQFCNLQHHFSPEEIGVAVN